MNMVCLILDISVGWQSIESFWTLMFMSKIE